jgi:uncharacterized protein
MPPHREKLVSLPKGILLVLLGFTAASAQETSEPFSLRGVVKSIDLDGRRLIVHDGESDKDVAIAVTGQTSIRSGAISKVDLDRIKPGSLVEIDDAVVATHIHVLNQIMGRIKSVSPISRIIVVEDEASGKDIELRLNGQLELWKGRNVETTLIGLKTGSNVTIMRTGRGTSKIVVDSEPASIIQEFWENFRHNLFKPLLLFFFVGFLVPILHVKFKFPNALYQALTIFLLVAIGWHGGEELASLNRKELAGAFGFMLVGFVLNFCIGILAYFGLSLLTKMRRVDKATVAGFYGSDSAGTFVTCLGVLTTARITYAAYMPVMLAVMEIPGCLVALYLVSRLRDRGMDPRGNMPDEPGYDPHAKPPAVVKDPEEHDEEETDEHVAGAIKDAEKLTMRSGEHAQNVDPHSHGLISPQLLHEVFLNPGLFLLFGGIFIGFLSGLQGAGVTRDDDRLFVDLFQGVLCLFLLEMGMTASRKLRDLKTAGLGYIAFGLLAPNVFATIGILVAHAYAWATGAHFLLGSYVLFSVLCAAASYIAVPAVQRLAIPEASPTLPLAAALGLTFTYNVTIGIPVYLEVAKAVMRAFPLP